MFYLPPDEFWYLTVARLAVTFDDRVTGSGTGFFVFDKTHYFLVTARHVVDPTYLPANKKRSAVLRQMDVSFQCAINAGSSEAQMGYKVIRVTEPDFVYAGDDVDVAVIKIPQHALPIVSPLGIIRPCSFPVEFLARQVDLELRYAGEPVVFVGFPDNAVRRWGGSELYLPLLRQGVFAYPPVHGVDVEGQLGRDYGLLDCYAQSGFSGGPVISLQKGWADGSWHPAEQHRAPMVVGAICGHYRSSQDRSDGVHAGLSYFARSTSIGPVIEKLQQDQTSES